MTDRPSLAYLVELARGAGDILRLSYRGDFAIHQKGEIDLVTEIDHISEEYLIGEIHKRFPQHRILSEESSEKDGST